MLGSTEVITAPLAPLTSPPMIDVNALGKSFPVAYGVMAWLRHRGRPPRRRALGPISFAVGRGELLGLLGPNGAGKTTLLKLLATLVVPDEGRILIDGIDVAKRPLLAKRKVGLCTNEERSFYFRLTARENLRFFGALAGLRGRYLERRIEEVIGIVGLGDSLDRRFASYSSGMRQRLTVARALLGDPEVIFLDEPTRAVDPVHAETLRQFFRRVLIGELGKTVILATNLLEEAWSLCDRVAVLNEGNLVALGPPRSLDTELHRVSRYDVTIGESNDALLCELRAVPGCAVLDVVAVEQGWLLKLALTDLDPSLNELVHVLGRNGNRVRAFRSIEPEPFDIFKEITTVK